MKCAIGMLFTLGWPLCRTVQSPSDVQANTSPTADGGSGRLQHSRSAQSDEALSSHLFVAYGNLHTRVEVSGTLRITYAPG